MGLMQVPAGRDIPNDINVVIEISTNSGPIKYEIDKASGAMMVDRFMSTAMHYPCDYGYVPGTLSEDGDPIDVLVIAPFPLFPQSVVRCRPIGMLRMTDESGIDTKILAVPVDKLTPLYKHVHSPQDLPAMLLKQISHFFEHYKDLEENKWVKVDGFENAEAAKKEILASIERFKKTA